MAQTEDKRTPDTPYLEGNVVILFSSATGKTSAELKRGVSPVIRYSCRIVAKTGMIIDGHYDRNGLFLSALLSGDKRSATIGGLITACNMTFTDTFELKVKTSGNDDLKGVTKTFKIKIICYGYDRPMFANHFLEFSQKRDKIKGRQKLMPVTVNSIAKIGIGSLNLEKSNITVRSIATDNKDTEIYYECGALGLPGIYAATVWAQTYEGGANTAGHRVRNPFPPGQAEDVTLFGIYDDYYRKGDVCVGLPYAVNFTPKIPDKTPVQFSQPYSLWDGVMEGYGGLFAPELDLFKNLKYYERHIKEQISEKSVQHTVFRLERGDSNTWKLLKTVYLDDNEGSAKWQEIAAVQGREFKLPGGDGKSTITCTACLPPFSKWGGMTPDGDGELWVKGHGFFHTVYVTPVSSAKPEVFKLYVNSKNNVLRNDPEKDGVTNIVTAAGSPVAQDVQPVTTARTVIPYAPPRKGDTALSALSYTDSKGQKKVTPHALNPVLSGYCIGGENGAGGIWKRYPLTRLISAEPWENLKYSVSGYRDEKNVTKSDTIRSTLVKGERLETDMHGYPGANRTIVTEDFGDKYQKQEKLNNSQKLTFSATVPVDGVIYQDGEIKSFCTLSNKESASISAEGGEYSESQIFLKSTTRQESVWVNMDSYKLVAGIVVRASYGLERLEVREPGIVTPAGSEERIVKYSEEKASGTGKGSVDAYLHFGQLDTEDGRKIAQSASYCANFSAECKKPWQKQTVYKKNGKTVSDKRERGDINVSLSSTLTKAEPFPRIANPDALGSLPEVPVKKSYFDRDIDIEYSASGEAGFTGENYTWEFENVEVGTKELVVDWTDDDGDVHHTPYSYPCYCTVGKAEIERLLIGKRASVSASFSYNKGTNRASCSCRTGKLIDYRDEATVTHSQSAVPAASDRPTTHDTHTENTRKMSRVHKVYPSKLLEVSFVEHTASGDVYLIRKSKESSCGEYIVENGKVKVNKPIPDAAEFEEYKMRTDPGTVKQMFEQFCRENTPEIKEEDASAYMWSNTYADFTDAPLYPDTFTILNEKTENTQERKDQMTVRFKR